MSLRTPEVDVLVLGGGPAGLVTALALARRHWRVAVWERSDSELPRVGETLPPQATRKLRALGLWDRFLEGKHVAVPGIVAAWESPEPREIDFLFNPYGSGWHLDRSRFDAMLSDAAQKAGAQIRRGLRVGHVERNSDGLWLAQADARGELVQLEARFAVDATGRAAWLAQRCDARRTVFDQLVGVIGNCPSNGFGDHRLLLEAAERGWWYAARLPGDQTVVAWMTDADQLAHDPMTRQREWLEQWSKSPRMREFVPDVAQVTSLRVVPAGTSRLDQVAGTGWLAVGDAATAYDPLSSHGISKALDSGTRAARAIDLWLRQDERGIVCYSRWVQTTFAAYRREQLGHYSRVTRWPASDFWRRRRVQAATRKVVRQSDSVQL